MSKQVRVPLALLSICEHLFVYLRAHPSSKEIRTAIRVSGGYFSPPSEENTPSLETLITFLRKSREQAGDHVSPFDFIEKKFSQEKSIISIPPNRAHLLSWLCDLTSNMKADDKTISDLADAVHGLPRALTREPFDGTGFSETHFSPFIKSHADVFSMQEVKKLNELLTS